MEEIKLYGFSLKYADGSVDWGLILAVSEEAARQTLEGHALSGVEVTLTVDQPDYVHILQTQFNGLAFLTTDSTCN